MRIAVLVYGRLDKCGEHYANILESLGETNAIDFFVSSDASSESQLTEFIRLYKPVLYDNSPIQYAFDLSRYPGVRGETNIHNMTCHFINKNRVLRLLEEYIHTTKVEYECVVSLRIDCVFQTKFTFECVEENTIYIPEGYDYLQKCINDQIAYGTVDVMKKYNSINPVDLLEKGLAWRPHPETLNCANLHFHKLKIVRPSIQYYLAK